MELNHMGVMTKVCVTLFVFILCVQTPVSALANPKYASLVVDADTGVVISEENAGEVRYPASLTKMMTLYLTFRALEKGDLTLDSKLTVSSRAAAQPPSKMGLPRGDHISVRDAIMSLVIRSANDIAVVVAEGVAGTEWEFAARMNRMASDLGMSDTHFINASGLHHPKQYSTAYDLAKLAMALRRDYPQYYELFKHSRFTFRGQTYVSHNRVTMKYQGADGLKTGYVNASGFNLVTTAQRGQNRLVGVVLGGRSGYTRDQHMMKLLDQSFYQLAHNNKAGVEKALASAPTPAPKPVEAVMTTYEKTDLKLVETAEAKEETIDSLLSEGDITADDAEIPIPNLKP